MRTRRQILLTLVFPLSLAMSASLPAGAQAQGSQPLHLGPDPSAAIADKLQIPLPPEEVASFGADYHNLLDRLEKLNSRDPDNLRRILKVRQDIDNFTPEEMNMFANMYDRAALSGAVKRLNSLPSKKKEPSSPTNLPISDPDYGICPPPGSDAGTEKTILTLLEVAEAATIVADTLCSSLFVAFGAGTNVPLCIIDAAVKGVQLAIQVTKEHNEFCDSNITAAEVHTAWQDAIVIHTDLASLDTHLGNVDNHITGEFTALDGHLSAVDLDLNNHLSAVDLDLNNHLTAVDAEIDAQIAALKAFQLQMGIEENLGAINPVGMYELPLAKGGQLETVRTIVNNTIANMVAAGQPVANALSKLAQGDALFAALKYKQAYIAYQAAYNAATH